MGCFKNHLQGCSKKGCFTAETWLHLRFASHFLVLKCYLQSPIECNPITGENTGTYPNIYSLFFLCNRIPTVVGHTEIRSERKHCSISKWDKWKCYVDSLKGCIKGEAIHLGEVPLLPFYGIQHKHEGWSFSSHFGAQGTVHGSHWLRWSSTDRALFLTTVLHKVWLTPFMREKQMLLFHLLSFGTSLLHTAACNSKLISPWITTSLWEIGVSAIYTSLNLLWQ